jgi:hypothetical protein
VLEFKYTKPEAKKYSISAPKQKKKSSWKPKRETPKRFKSYLATPETLEEPQKLSEVSTGFNIFNLPEFLPLDTRR